MLMSGGPLWAFACLAIVFTTKHFVADFLLQNRWIAIGKEGTSHWGRPLLVHVGLHALATLAIVLAVAPRLWWLAAVDFGIHFCVDRAKCLLAHRGGWTPQDARYWWLLGFDQYLHQLTNIGLAAAIVVL